MDMIDKTKVFYVIQFKDENCFKCGFSHASSIEEAKEKLEKNLPKFDYLLIEQGYDKGKETALLNKVNCGYEPKDLFTVKGRKRYAVRGNRKFFTLPDGVTIKSLIDGDELCYVWVVKDRLALKMTKNKPLEYSWCSVPCTIKEGKRLINIFKSITIPVESNSKKEYCFKFDRERPKLDDVLLAIDGSLRILIVERCGDWYLTRYTKGSLEEPTKGFEIVFRKLMSESDAKQFKTKFFSLGGGGEKVNFDYNIGYRRVIKVAEDEIDEFISNALSMDSPIEAPRLLWLLKTGETYILKNSQQPLAVWASELLETKNPEVILAVPYSNKLKKGLEDNSDKKSVKKDEYSIELRNFKKDPIEIYKRCKEELEFFAYLLYFPELGMYRYGATKLSSQDAVPKQKIFTSQKCSLICTKYATVSQAKYEMSRIDEVFERIEDHREDGCYFRLGKYKEDKLETDFLNNNFVKE
jgi:hypothetical protein